MIRIIAKRDTEERWKLSSFIPRKNELISIIDKKQLVIGDGVTSFEHLPRYDVNEKFEEIVLVYNESEPLVVLNLRGDSND